MGKTQMRTNFDNCYGRRYTITQAAVLFKEFGYSYIDTSDLKDYNINTNDIEHLRMFGLIKVKNLNCTRSLGGIHFIKNPNELL